MPSYDLTLAAETDLRDIWRYTYKTWGFDQAEKYFDQIEACCEAVGDGRARSKVLEGLQEGVHIHRCEHHFIVWLAGTRRDCVETLIFGKHLRLLGADERH